MNYSIIISIVSLSLSILTFVTNQINNKRNKTVDEFSKLRSDVLDKLDALSLDDIDGAYKDNDTSKKSEIRNYMAKLEAFCVLVNNKYLDFNLFKKMNNSFINSTNMILKYKRVLHNMRKTNQGYYCNLSKAIGKLKNNSKFDLDKEVK